MKTRHRFTIIVEKDEDGYFAYCPQLQGCYTQGDTYEEVIGNMEEVIRLHLEDRMNEKESWKAPEMINVTSVELAI